VWAPPVLRPNRVPVVIGPRAAEVLTDVCVGFTNDQIGQRMRISENSVKTHLKRLMHEFGALNRAHLVALTASGQVPVLVRVDGWSA
jgi:DNA-binding CsgD family transcriptional regulator